MGSIDAYWDSVYLGAEEEKTTASYGYQSIDYTVLSVVVVTLGLILLVELVRHKIDHLAKGRPFFTELITCVNSELATLGIVEFFLVIVQKYYARLNKDQKAVFADVHFMLFYCALFNAIGSAILAIKVFSVAERTWVRTELLDLDHYIEIREEFERVDAILYGENHDITEFVLEYSVLGVMLGLKHLWQRVYRFVRYPMLSKRRSELLVQVRFHDLRVHFLKANNLPLQLHVSNYLKRSLLKKLKRLVHVSAVAWLLLTGVVNLVYFLMGIVVYVTGDVGVVGLSLTWIYLSSMVLFVVLSLMINNKTNWIFQRIMRMKLINENVNSNFKSGMNIRKGEKEVQSQSDLFWGGDPNYITVAIQFSQFGFALALSILLVFWDDVNVKGNPVPIYAYPVTVFACYGAFVLIMAQVIPRYTLCTSLGQLVNKKTLHETLAQYYLEDAQRKRQQLLDEQDDEYFETEANGNVPDFDSSVTPRLLDWSKTEAEKPALAADLAQSDQQALHSSRSDRTQRLERTRSCKAASEGVACMRHNSGTQKVPQVSEPRPKIVRQKSTSSSAAIQQMKDANHDEAKPASKSSSRSLLVLLADLVQTDTHSLRSAMPVKNSTRNQQGTRSLRVKAASGGVASMRQMSGEQIPPARLVRQKSKSLSTSIQQMKDAENVAQPMPKSLSESSLTGSSENLVSSTLEHLEDKPLANHAPASRSPPCRVPFPKNSMEALPQLDNVSDSDNHNHSNVSDHPSVDLEAKVHASEPEKYRTLHDAACDYFLGPKYPVVSAVFGTLGVFFVIGQRIEGLLLATGTLDNLMNTYHFPPVVTFWWETAYLCCFIGASCFISVIFRTGRASTNRARALFLAGVLDVVLSGSCLALLMIAEAQRCYCAEGDEVTAECCAPFGSRSNGGVGNIEPITSIIMLRLFRFAFAQRVVQFLGKRVEWPNTGVTLEKHQNGRHGRHSVTQHDAVVGMWQLGVSMYPDVVEEHGEFSSELLQAMLGIGIVEDSAKRAVSTTYRKESVTAKVDVSSEDETTKASSNAGCAYVPKRVSHSQQATDTTADERHASFSPEVHTVNGGGQANRSVSAPVLAPKSPLESVLGPSVEESDDEQFPFISPRAKLVRSMRRCDRKLLPLIDRWNVVDLVVTKHEIVFFDASDVDEPCSTKYSPEALRAMEISRQALRATKGGKGLRLRDVAAGRTVVGRLAISAINSVHVERRLPLEEDADQLDPEEDIGRLNEFWESNKSKVEHLAKDDQSLCREARWARLKEDHLMIHSNRGILCFRFFSDLGDAETNRDRCLSERVDSGSLCKNTALLWCQTVVRLCKRAQLKQKLDHYGKDDDEELRGYLQVVGPKKELPFRVLGELRGRARHFRRMSSLRTTNKSDDVKTASIHAGNTSSRFDDCEFVDVL